MDILALNLCLKNRYQYGNKKEALQQVKRRIQCLGKALGRNALKNRGKLE